MRDVPPQGSIEDVFLPRLVAGLHLHEFEGSLRLTLADSIKILYFKRGEIASAASNAEEDRLASILIREGRLTPEHFDMARARLAPGASLGKTLIELGFLSPTELLQGARRQVQVILASSFASAAGGYEMIPGPLPPEVTSLGLATRRLLFDALSQSVDRGAIVREIGSMEAVYRPTGRLESVLASLKLDSETDRIARLLNGSASLREISGRTSHDDLTVGRIVLALELLGAAERLPGTEEEAVQVAVAPEAAGPEVPEPAETGPIGTAPTETGPIDTPPAEPPPPETVSVAPAPAEAAPPEAPAEADEAIVIEVEDAPTAPLSLIASGEASDPLRADDASPPEDPAGHLTPPVAPAGWTAEPPPIPADELPAFTRPPDELPDTTSSPSASPGGPLWEVNPVTGERVHVGPVEMMFDGRISPGAGESRNAMRLLVGAGAATLVLGGALGYVLLLRRGEGEPVAATRSSTPPAIAAEIPAPVPAAAARTPPQKEPEPAAVKTPPAAIEAGAPAASKSLEPAPATPRPATAIPRPSPRAAPTAAIEPETPAAAIPTPVPPAPALAEEERPARRPAPANGPAFASARRDLDQGDIAGAARKFESWILSEGTERFTLQVMIACQEETVRGAGGRAPAETPLFVLPYSLKGRPCYRVCWGLYPDGGAARGAFSQVPASLAGPAAPLVVPVSRLRSSG